MSNATGCFSSCFQIPGHESQLSRQKVLVAILKLKHLRPESCSGLFRGINALNEYLLESRSQPMN